MRDKTDRERINLYYRRRMAWIQAEPPKWLFIAWIRWRWREPRY